MNIMPPAVIPTFYFLFYTVNNITMLAVGCSEMRAKGGFGSQNDAGRCLTMDPCYIAICRPQ